MAAISESWTVDMPPAFGTPQIFEWVVPFFALCITKYTIQWNSNQCKPPPNILIEICGTVSNNKCDPYAHGPSVNHREFIFKKEHPLVPKLSGVCKGTRLHIIPLSTDKGDEYTAVGRHCTGFGESVVLLSEPFSAQLEDFDGETLLVRTDFYYRLKVPISNLKNLIVSCSKHGQ